MLRSASLTRKRFASGRVKSCDKWMFGASFPQAGYTATCRRDAGTGFLGEDADRYLGAI
jgi:hypothetical protein